MSGLRHLGVFLEPDPDVDVQALSSDTVAKVNFHTPGALILQTRNVARYRFRFRRTMALLLASVAFALLGSTVAQALFASTQIAFLSPPTSSDFCVLHRPEFRKPSQNPGNEMDVNVWAYYRDNTTSGCGLSNATKPFTASPQYSIDGGVCRWSDGTFCTTITKKTISTSYSDFGVGKPYNRTGACAGVTTFGFIQNTYQGTTPKAYFWQFTF